MRHYGVGRSSVIPTALLWKPFHPVECAIHWGLSTLFRCHQFKTLDEDQWSIFAHGEVNDQWRNHARAHLHSQCGERVKSFSEREGMSLEVPMNLSDRPEAFTASALMGSKALELAISCEDNAGGMNGVVFGVSGRGHGYFFFLFSRTTWR